MGYAANLDPGYIRAYFFRDQSTYYKRWKDQYYQLRIYANQMQNGSATSLDSFLPRINPQIGVNYNEVLAHPPKEAHFASVIGRDCPEARELAKQRQQEIWCKFPIVLYDCERDRVGIYNPIEFECRKNLTKIKNELDKIYKSKNREGFFAFFASKKLNTQNLQGFPETITTLEYQNILKLYTQAERAEIPWKQAYDEMQKQVHKKEKGLRRINVIPAQAGISRLG